MDYFVRRGSQAMMVDSSSDESDDLGTLDANGELPTFGFLKKKDSDDGG